MEVPPLETERLLIRPLSETEHQAVAAILDADPADSADAATQRYVRHGGLNATALPDPVWFQIVGILENSMP